METAVSTANIHKHQTNKEGDEKEGVWWPGKCWRDTETKEHGSSPGLEGHSDRIWHRARQIMLPEQEHRPQDPSSKHTTAHQTERQ
ncbi:uncharacterized [Tachysurus ichikawai]